MNDIDINRIQLLIDRFLDGETSLPEEKELRDYFASGGIADEFKQYTEMFEWFGSISNRPVVSEKHPRLYFWRHWVSAAAVIALLFTAGFYVRSYSYNTRYLAYKGSYIVRDGKKITDLSIVGPEAERIQREFDERLRQAEIAIRAADEKINAVNMACADLPSARL